MRFAASFLIVMSVLYSAAAEETYGHYSSGPHGTWIPGPERPLYRIDKKYTYTDTSQRLEQVFGPHETNWIAPKGEVVDGASIPDLAWTMVGGPFSGNYFYASIIHDYYCCSKSRDYDLTNAEFMYGMLASGVERWQAELMTLGVLIGGPPRWQVDENFVHGEVCNPDPAMLSTSLYDGFTDTGKRLFFTKYAGMARTLKATSGRVLDVVGERLIFPNSNSAKIHLKNVRKILKLGDIKNLKEFGLMSYFTEYEIGRLDVVQAWAVGQVPVLDAYVEKNRHLDLDMFEKHFEKRNSTPWVFRDLNSPKIQEVFFGIPNHVLTLNPTEPTS